MKTTAFDRIMTACMFAIAIASACIVSASIEELNAINMNSGRAPAMETVAKK